MANYRKKPVENVARNYVPEGALVPCADDMWALTFRDRVALVEAGRSLTTFSEDVLRALCGEAAECVAEVDSEAAKELAVRLRKAWNGEDPE